MVLLIPEMLSKHLFYCSKAKQFFMVCFAVRAFFVVVFCF
jgi:hypothetical protein